MKSTIRKLQTGQSMVEYVVILAALMAALLAPGLGSIGTDQTEQDSLLKAVVDKHRGHTYALSLSEIPETDDMASLSNYYDSLGKYPDLSQQLGKVGRFTGGLKQLGSALNQLPNYLPPTLSFPSPGSPPSIP